MRPRLERVAGMQDQGVAVWAVVIAHLSTAGSPYPEQNQEHSLQPHHNNAFTVGAISQLQI